MRSTGRGWRPARRGRRPALRVTGRGSDRTGDGRHGCGGKYDRRARLEAGAREAERGDRRDRPRARGRLPATGLLIGIVIDENRPEYERGDFLIRGLLGADRSSGALAVGDHRSGRPDGPLSRPRRHARRTRIFGRRWRFRPRRWPAGIQPARAPRATRGRPCSRCRPLRSARLPYPGSSARARSDRSAGATSCTDSRRRSRCSRPSVSAPAKPSLGEAVVRPTLDFRCAQGDSIRLLAGQVGSIQCAAGDGRSPMRALGSEVASYPCWTAGMPADLDLLDDRDRSPGCSRSGQLTRGRDSDGSRGRRRCVATSVQQRFADRRSLDDVWSLLAWVQASRR